MFVLTTTLAFPADSTSKAAKNVPLHCLVHSVALRNKLLLSKKTSNITLPFDLPAQKVSFFGKIENFQYDYCRLVCGS
jgi:hypothetical protein